MIKESGDQQWSLSEKEVIRYECIKVFSTQEPSSIYCFNIHRV